MNQILTSNSVYSRHNIKKMDLMNSSIDCEDPPENPEVNSTYYSISVEEVSLVKLQQSDVWTNRRVRVLGLMKDREESHLKSVMEEGGPYSVRVDTSTSDKPVPLNTVVQLFGVVKIDASSNTPYIQVRFFRDMTNVDLQALREVMELQRTLVQNFS